MEKVVIILNNNLEFPLREGIRKEAWWHAKALEREGYEVTLYVFNKNRYSLLKKNTEIKKENINIVDTTIFQLRKIRADYLYIFSAPSIDFTFLKKVKSKRTIMFIFDGECNRFWTSFYSRWNLKRLKYKIDYYIIQTNYQKNRLKKYVEKNKIKKILPLFLDEREFLLNQKRYKNRLLFMSHFGEEKGIMDVLEAFVELNKKDKNKWELVIANSGLNENIEVNKKIDRLIEKKYRIIKKGVVNPIEELNKSEIYLYTFKKVNNTFSVPLSLIEAIKSNTKYISSKLGGVAEYFNDENLIEKIDSKNIVRAIKNIKNNNIGNREKEINIDNKKIIKEILELNKDKIGFISIRNQKRPHFVHDNFAQRIGAEQINIGLEGDFNVFSNLIYSFKNLKKYRNKYDILFLNGGQTLILNYLIRIFSKNKIKTIYLNADPLFQIFEKLGLIKKILYKNLFLKVDGLISVSKINYAKSKKILNKPNIIVNPYYDLEKNKNSKKEEIFLFIGKFREEKNFINTLKGFQNFKEKEKKVKLIVIGIEKSEINYKITDNVEFKGRLSRLEIKKYYEKAKFLLLFSHQDSFPVVLMEAMSQGVIPIISENIGNSYLIDDKLKLQSKNLYNYKEISKQIEKVYNFSEEEKGKIKKENLIRVKEFSKKNILEKFEKEFFELIKEIK